MIVMERIPIERGQQAVLCIEDAEGERWCPSRILQSEDETIWVGAPPPDCGVPALQVGETLTLRTWRETDALYALRARVIGVEQGAHAGVGLRIVDSERIQRREFFRIPYRVLQDVTLVAPDNPPRRCQLVLVDLSAGGLGVRSVAPLVLATELRLDLALPGNAEPLPLRASVERVEHAPERPEYPWEGGAMLTDVKAAVREQLVRYIIHYQREQLRRGAL